MKMMQKLFLAAFFAVFAFGSKAALAELSEEQADAIALKCKEAADFSKSESPRPSSFSTQNRRGDLVVCCD
jgi:hypothetical protein